MLGIKPRRGHGRLEVKAKPFLNPDAPQLRRPLCQVQKQHEIEHNRRGKNRIPTEKVDLDLHGVAEPPENQPSGSVRHWQTVLLRSARHRRKSWKERRPRHSTAWLFRTISPIDGQL